MATRFKHGQTIWIETGRGSVLQAEFLREPSLGFSRCRLLDYSEHDFLTIHAYATELDAIDAELANMDMCARTLRERREIIIKEKPDAE